MENIFEKESGQKEINIKELKDKWNEAYKKDALGTHEKIIEFAEKIKNKYPDYQDYMLYHLLIGSIPKSKLPKFDFPGEDSVEKFIESL